MKKVLNLMIILCLCCLCAAAGADPPPAMMEQQALPGHLTPGAGNLTVKASGFRNDQGVAWFMLFNSPDGFPFIPAKILGAGVSANYAAEATFSDLPFGEYAVLVWHDINANELPDFRGEDREGGGLSNNPKSYTYEAAKFDLGTAQMELTVQISYQITEEDFIGN